MPTNLQIRRGLQSALPTGLAGEPLFTTDTKRLYISDGTATNLLQGAATLLTTGAIPFSDANGKLTMSASNLYWDNTNNRLGIGTTTPSVALTIFGTNELLQIGDGSAANSSYISFNGTRSQIGYKSNGLHLLTSTGRSLVFGSGTFASTTAWGVFFATTGNLGINTVTDAGYKLDVNGTARVQGVLTTTADALVNGVNIGIGGGSISTNTRVGSGALFANTTGASNTALGFSSLFANTTGSQNTSIGRNALVANTTGANNTAIGHTALVNISNGGGNTALGALSGRFITDGTTPNTTTNNSVFLGADTRALADNQTNQIVIGYNATGAGSNTATIGNTSIVDTILRGRINIQQYATGSRPTYVKGALIYDSTLGKLVVGGNAGWEVVTSV